MKKTIITMFAVLVSICSFAQTGDKAIGLNFKYGTDSQNFGIGVKGQYNFTDNLRGEASFNYFLEKDGFKMWDINLNAHYLFPLSDKVKVYPIVGLTYVNATVGWDLGEDEDYSDSEGKIGLNLGGGISYDITNKLAVNFEIQYKMVKYFDQALVGVGVAYKF